MTARGVEAIVRALNEARVRYLIAGGLAVVAHGHLRYTADVDLMIDLTDEDNARRAMQSLESLGYRPRLPVPSSGFTDRATRETWIRDKGMMVFSMITPDPRDTGIDLFVDPPLEFGAAMERAAVFEVAPGVKATFIGFDDLIRLKKLAGRPIDLDDVERLEALKKDLEERR